MPTPLRLHDEPFGLPLRVEADTELLRPRVKHVLRRNHPASVGVVESLFESPHVTVEEGIEPGRPAPLPLKVEGLKFLCHDRNNLLEVFYEQE